MFRLKMTFTVATATGSGPWAINFTLPVTAITADQAFSGFQYNNTTNLPAFFYGGILASTSLGSAGINITTNDYTVWCSGVYEAN